MIMFVLIWFVSAHFKKRLGSGQEDHSPLKLQETDQGENRRHPRVNATFPVRIETSNGPMEGETRNISLGGAFICCQRPLPLRENFRLTLDAPNHDPLMFNAEVVWSNINVPDEKILNRGMGVRFIRITKADRQFLNDVLSVHPENSTR